VLVLAAFVAIGLGWDTGLLTRLSLSSTARVEQSLIDAIRSGSSAGHDSAGGSMSGSMSGSMAMSGKSLRTGPPVEGELPSLDGAVTWLNSQALSRESLRGKVVLIDFWTYSCINCLRTLPYLKAWYERYKDHGLVIIGIHAPEFAFEKDEANVRRAVSDLGIHYPVALDNHYAIWQAFNNQYWPAHYFVDDKGQIRGHHFGEGNYEESEQLIRELLTASGQSNIPASASGMGREGVQAPPDESNNQSPETYVGYERAEHFSSPGAVMRDAPESYTAPQKLPLNAWALEGRWTIGGEKAQSNTANGRITFRFHAQDLHLVLGPSAAGKSVRFKVTLDGGAPAINRGMDVNEQGEGAVSEQRLYQLIRQTGPVRDRTFTIEFLDSGVQAYAFTFG